MAPGLTVAADRPVCQFGIFPYLPALKLERLYAPLVALMSDALGMPVQLRTKATFEEYLEELHESAYDVILVHPFFLVEAIDHFGYSPLARVAGDMTAVVLAKSDAGYAGIDGLRGRTVALPPRLAGVSFLMKMALAEHGLVPGIDLELRHFKTKISCLHAVAIGEADGCVLPSFMVGQIDTIEQMGLVPVAESQSVPNLGFAASHRIPQPARARLAKALLGLKDSEHGRTVLARAHLPGLLPISAEDFDVIRRYALQSPISSTF